MSPHFSSPTTWAKIRTSLARSNNVSSSFEGGDNFDPVGSILPRKDVNESGNTGS
jgi:hypothetical protein